MLANEIPTSVTILSGIVISGFGMLVGRFIGEKSRVSEPTCKERRTSCNALLLEKIKSLDKKLDSRFDILEAKIASLTN